MSKMIPKRKEPSLFESTTKEVTINPWNKWKYLSPKNDDNDDDDDDDDDNYDGSSASSILQEWQS